MEFNKKNIRIILLLITYTVGLFWVAQNVKSFPDFFSTIIALVSPFVLGCGMAYVINIPTSFFERIIFGHRWKNHDNIRLKIKRSVSLIISLLIILSIIIGLFAMIIPTLIQTIQNLTVSVPDAIERAQNWLLKLQQNSPKLTKLIGQLGIDFNKVSSDLVSMLSNVARSLVNSTLAFSMGLVGFLFNFVVSIIFSTYLIGQKETIGSQSLRLLYATVPEKWADRVRSLFALANRCFRNFISGQLLEACIFGTLITLALAFFNFPYALLIGVVSGFMAIIPVLGGWIAAVLGSVLQLTVSPLNMLYFIITYLVVQQIEGNLIFPHVVGKRVGLPPFIVLIAVVLGGALWGILGALVSIPIFSMGYELLSRFVRKRFLERRLSTEKTTIEDVNYEGARDRMTFKEFFIKTGDRLVIIFSKKNDISKIFHHDKPQDDDQSKEDKGEESEEK